jgi:hypothetical protein
LLAGLLVVGASLATSPRDARAEGEPIDADARVFAGAETRTGAARLALGAASIGGGAFALSQGTAFGRGFSAPLFAGGVVQLAFGVDGLLSGAADRRRADAAYSDSSWAVGEGGRIETTLDRLRVRQAIEASLFAVGGLTAFFGNGNDAVRGFGLGLGLESAILLAGDVFAGRRADRYAEALGRFRIGAAPTRSGAVLVLAAALD